MKIFFAGVFHHFSNWLLNLRAASCDASSKMKTFVGNNFQLSLSQHDFSLWWIEDLLLGVFSDMEDWKGQILGILKKIKVNCTIIRLWDKFNNSFYEVKHSSSLARRFYPYVNILLCFVFQDQCIAMYHIFEVHLSHIFCWRKKWHDARIKLMPYTCWHKHFCSATSRRCPRSRIQLPGARPTWEILRSDVSPKALKKKSTIRQILIKECLYLASWSKTSTLALTSRNILTKSMCPFDAARRRGDQPDLRGSLLN